MQTVVVVYSRSGRSLRIAEILAEHCHARLCRIDCPRYDGALGWWRGWWDAWRGHLPEIALTPAIGAADFLILGGPIWAGRFAPPLRSVMAKARRLPPVAGVFMTRRRIGCSLPLEADLDALAEVGVDPATDPALLTITSRSDCNTNDHAVIAGFADLLEPRLRRRKLPAILLRHAA